MTTYPHIERFDGQCVFVVSGVDHRALHFGICYACKRKGAIKWNPWNKVVQCHHCGQTIAFPKEDDREKVMFT